VGVTAAAKAVALLGGNREEVWEWWSKGAAAVRTAKRSSRPWAEGDGRMGDDLAAAGDGWMRRRLVGRCLPVPRAAASDFYDTQPQGTGRSWRFIS